MHGRVMMDRRKLLYGLAAFSVASVGSPRGRSAETKRRFRAGLVGVAGAGMYFLHPVARQLGFAYKTIAIETQANHDRLGWCHGEELLLIGGEGAMPRTIDDARRM